MNSVSVSDLLINTSEDEGSRGVTFTAKIGVPLSAVPYEVVDVPTETVDFNFSASSSDSSTEIDSSNN